MTIKSVRIEDCADVRPGFSAKGAIVHDPEGSLQVITAQHITRGDVYRYTKDHALLIAPPKFYEKYLVTADDILTLPRSSVSILPTIAPLTFFIIKPRQNVLSDYMAWYLNQDMMKAKLNEIRTGAGTPMIPSKELRELLIPLPPLETQKKIAKLGRLQMREKQLLHQLAEETDRLHQTVGRSLLSNSNQHAR